MEPKIVALKIICGILQFGGVVLFFFTRTAGPATSSLIWGLIAISGFAAIVQAATDQRTTSSGVLAGAVGFVLMLFALQSLSIH
ncbi:MAG: hypothetical protein A2937_00855 [Candidatus Yonathbacteria bacterium RIFCSPLOWO2_01_FULL_47_33b]|uniref:Uncharacterized protein n=1 Tax=Candidatus Yonathbacteria bacterium RIFCSPLOWO2_01_FULL_47_33b TaxID=1802727 RepID=A0A1G2SFY6_9BACT|nr:MAG: hypothetical protein A2937_00855 [Candidatus Yonathbacteria bacterium RIFCSPLOWO2_01_FULL_47_33b]